MLKVREPSGEHISRAAASYPADLNLKIVELFFSHPRARASTAVFQAPLARQPPRGIPEAEAVEFTSQLRGYRSGGKKATRKQEDIDCIGGMARTSRCVAALPGNIVAGGQIRVLMDAFLLRWPDLIATCCSAIGAEDPSAGPSEASLDELREILAVHLRTSDTGPVANGDCTSPIRAGLLSAWASKAGDPGAAAAAWVRDGAPAGILSDPLLAGVFPLAELVPGDVLDPAALEHDLDGFTNYAGIDEDLDVRSQIEAFTAKGYLKEFACLAECTAYLGAPPLLSRFGAITKLRHGKVKKRIILDVKRSRVKECTRKVHRVPLPRVTDVAFDILDSLAKFGFEPGDGIELLVLDFSDAFWNIPLAAEERRFFVGQLRGKFYVFLRAAQGSRNGPLAWAGVISLVMRLVQAVFWERGVCPVRLNTYVDDPLAMIRGTVAERRRLIAMLILLWRALGLPLAFSKGCLGRSVGWIGLVVEVQVHSVIVTISAARIAELLSLTVEALAGNVVSRKWLRSYAGKANSFASILVFWRPFLQFLWAAIYSENSQGAPANCVWTRQILLSLQWIAAFLRDQKGDMQRRFSLEAFRGRGQSVSMCFDASPWGAGGFLIVDGKLQSWFATAFTVVDERAVSLVFGTSTCQQVAEALAILFGLRAWLSAWQDKALRLEVRSDSVTALSMLARMQTSSPHVGVVAREVALTLSSACVRPCVIAHTPGVANKLADALSRRYQPGAAWQRPAAVALIAECILAPRDASYYRTCG
jgi:hypothetical protein